MSTIGATALTLVDWAKRLDPNGNVPMIGELLNQTNEVLTDMLWIEGNLPTGHRGTIRTGLPTTTWRKLYGGVQPSKSTTAQIDDACGMLEARSEPDKKLCDLNGNTNAFRLSESLAFLEAMNQSFVTALLAGDSTLNPEQFNGLQVRYPSLTGATAKSVVNAGGSGTDACSMWLIAWGANTVTGIFPKGSSAGLSHQDLGEIDAFDSANPPGRYRAYGDRYSWDCGLHVKDWRYVVRIANIDLSDLQSQVVTQTQTIGTNILSCMIRAKHRLPTMGLGRPVFYCNRSVRAGLDWMALNKSSNALTISEAVGQVQTQFLGIPIRTVDALGIAETYLT